MAPNSNIVPLCCDSHDIAIAAEEAAAAAAVAAGFAGQPKFGSAAAAAAANAAALAGANVRGGRPPFVTDVNVKAELSPPHPYTTNTKGQPAPHSRGLLEIYDLRHKG